MKTLTTSKTIGWCLLLGCALFLSARIAMTIGEVVRCVAPPAAAVASPPAPAEAENAEESSPADAAPANVVPDLKAGLPDAEYVAPLLDYVHQYHKDLMERAKANAALPEEQRDPEVPTPAQVEESRQSGAIPM